MKKELYIDLMELALSAYSDEHMKSYTNSVIENGLAEHGYTRLTVNLGVLIAHDRKSEYKDEFRKMMDLCCREIPVAYNKNGHQVGNDFSVKEIVLCLLEIEKNGIFEKEVTDGWRKELAKINIFDTYSVIATRPPEQIHNWAAFGAVSEQLRKYAGIGDESNFIENQIKSQMLAFDQNGMYRDPNEPMVYDSVTRLQLAMALYFGYEGENRQALEEELIKSADMTLEMQSVTGEIPFGGRSAQFLHNEAHLAALCEFYAGVFKKRGDINKAGQFKSAARVAAESIVPWLKGDKIYHIKNYYPNDSMLGCEGYSYFDKYMITAGSMLYCAYVMADDEIAEIDCPAISENGICETSEHFHKVMCRYKDYFVEFDTNANPHYDANGLGRVHKRGLPSALCLSVPFSANPNYKIDIENPSPLSICGGIKTNDGYLYAYDESAEYELIDKEVSEDFVRVKFEVKLSDEYTLYQTCTLSADGVEFSVCGDGEVSIIFPAFDFDGSHKTKVSKSEKCVTVEYNDGRCSFSSEKEIQDLSKMYANRNGHYKAMAIYDANNVSLKINMY